MQRVLVTGGSGFMGAWVLRRLLQRGIAPRVFDLSDNRRTATEILGTAEAAALDWQVGDIRDGAAVRVALDGCDGVVHLAGVLTPFCNANPVQGAEINLIGTLQVFDAAVALGLRSVVYATSAGVFGPDDAQVPQPTTLYGAFKLACEGAARAYWVNHGLATVGFRPLVVYGPGREGGLSAGPSLACRAAARGEAYEHGFTGGTGLMYVDDVAQAFVHALFAPTAGAQVFNLIGDSVSVDEVLAQIRTIVPDARLTQAGPSLPIAPGIREDGLAEFLPELRRTPLRVGLEATVAHYRPR